MAKKKTEAPVSQEDFEAELQSVVPEKKQFNPDTALVGIAKTETGYSLVKVMLDSKSLVTGAPEIIDTAESKWEANEKFKIHVIKSGIL